MKLTKEELDEIFIYDSTTGDLIWREGRRHAGKIAGAVQRCGDRISGIHVGLRRDGRYYKILAHRAIWIMVKGGIDDNLQIDHKDRNPLNNLFDNLRLVTSSQNNANRACYGAVGYKGVYYANSITTKYAAYIRVNKKKTYLGTFITPEEAHAAYRVAATRAFGDSACFA